MRQSRDKLSRLAFMITFEQVAVFTIGIMVTLVQSSIQQHRPAGILAGRPTSLSLAYGARAVGKSCCVMMERVIAQLVCQVLSLDDDE